MAQSTAHKHDPTRRATYQDVLDAPAYLVAEVLDGTLHTHPRPAMPHGLATLALGTDLSNPFQFGRGGPGGWWIAFEPELHLGEEIVVPDLAGWRRERMPEYPQTAYVNRARIGRLDRRVERRAIRTGTDTVVVHPGNTSTTCTGCGRKDRKSRTGPVFECTRCGYRTDADWNAAINVKRRGHNIFSAWKATRERGRAGGSSRPEAGGEAGPGQREQAARGAPLQASPNACHLPRNTTGDARAPP